MKAESQQQNKATARNRGKMPELAPLELCTGCSACASACPCSAIAMRDNPEGFAYPFVDEVKCSACGRCQSVCPVLNLGKNRPTQIQKSPLCGCTRDEDTWKRSTSGGAFSEICNLFRDRDLVVFGAAFASDNHLIHMGVDVAYIDLLRKSKYLQSEIGDSYRACGEFLASGRFVIFSGTPCQIAGLRFFLGRNYDNLLTVELICHGVCSPKVFKSFLGHLSDQYGKKVAGYEFRVKPEGSPVAGYCSEVTFVDGSTKVLRWDVYNRLFLDQLTIRRSCGGNCQFRTPDRYADITLADSRKEQELYPWKAKGKNWSVVIANTKNGRDAIDGLRKFMDLHEYPLEYLRRTNSHYFEPAKGNPIRDDVFRLFCSDERDFWQEVLRFLPKKVSFARRAVRKLLRMVGM